MRKFYRTLITLEILSEYEPVPEGLSMEKLAYEIDEGDWLGMIKKHDYEELDGKTMTVFTIAQGSDPEFFGLDKDGNDLSEQELGLNLPVENKHVYFDDLNVPGLGLGVVKDGK